jgi:hypothetical protein
LIVNEGEFVTGSVFSLGTRALFLGILFAGPMFRADGSVAVINIPTGAVAIASTNIPSHLGYYVKASELVGLKAQLFSVWNVQ